MRWQRREACAERYHIASNDCNASAVGHYSLWIVPHGYPHERSVSTLFRSHDKNHYANLIVFSLLWLLLITDNDWGISNYPVVLGHEGVGVVTKIGSSVKGLKPGDRVGITWIRDSCGCCSPCMEGRENM